MKRLLLLLLLGFSCFALAQDERPVLVVGVADTPGGLDPGIELSNVGSRVVYSLYDTLIRRDFLDADKLKPMLAASWERLDDLRLELKLRDDVVFHNGDPFTSADVKFTFENMLNPDTVYTEPKAYFATFDRIEAPDPYTVIIHTKSPDPLLEQRLASWAAQILPKSYFESLGQEAFAQAPIGTGPYKFLEKVSDDRIVFEAFDGYWGDPVPVSQVIFREIPEVSARVTALVNGEADIVTNIPPDQISVINRYDNVEVRSVTLANSHVLRYNTTHPVLQDSRIRQAMNLAIDRQLLSEALWGGQAVVPHSHQYAEYGPLYNADRPQPAYDPEQARALIAESGYNGETIIFTTNATYYTNGLQAAEAITEMWRAVGLNAEVKVLDTASLPVDDPESMVTNWSNSTIYPDFDGALFRSWGPQGTPQRGGYWLAPEEFNELGIASRGTLDTEMRYANYQRMLDIWEEDAPGTILYQPLESYGVRKDLNWQPYSFYFMDLRGYNLAFLE